MLMGGQLLEKSLIVRTATRSSSWAGNSLTIPNILITSVNSRQLPLLHEKQPDLATETTRHACRTTQNAKRRDK